MRTIITVQPTYGATPDESPSYQSHSSSQRPTVVDSRIKQMIAGWTGPTTTAIISVLLVLAGFVAAMLLSSSAPAVSLLIALTVTASLIAAVMTRPKASKL